MIQVYIFQIAAEIPAIIDVIEPEYLTLGVGSFLRWFDDERKIPLDEKAIKPTHNGIQ